MLHAESFFRIRSYQPSPLATDEIEKKKIKQVGKSDVLKQKGKKKKKKKKKKNQSKSKANILALPIQQIIRKRNARCTLLPTHGDNRRGPTI